MTPPHEYVPPGPLDSAPPGGYRPPAGRLEALAAVLDGVDLGAYDMGLITWLAGLDDPTCRTVASIMWRCRQAGLPWSGGAMSQPPAQGAGARNADDPPLVAARLELDPEAVASVVGSLGYQLCLQATVVLSNDATQSTGGYVSDQPAMTTTAATSAGDDC